MRSFGGALPLSRRGAVAFVALFAFLFQVFACATHWHFAQSTPASVAQAAGGDLPSHPQKAPIKSEPCQLCQAMSGSSRYLSASALLLKEPQSAVFAWQITDTQAAIQIRLSHSWRGRAPPTQSEIT